MSFLAAGRPAPGEGPSESIRRDGSFSFEVIAKGTRPGEVARVRCEGIGDPGYAATSVMLAECAWCLALDGDTIPQRGGVLTPSTAMGHALVRRLQRTGHFAFDSVVSMPPVARI